MTMHVSVLSVLGPLSGGEEFHHNADSILVNRYLILSLKYILFRRVHNYFEAALRSLEILLFPYIGRKGTVK